MVVEVTGDQGNCTIPTNAAAVSANVTVANGTASSFLTIWSSDVSRPTASTNNWTAGQSPTPNQIDMKLSVDGRVSMFNDAGTADVIVDILGYYEPVAAAGVEYWTGPDATLNELTPTEVTSCNIATAVEIGTMGVQDFAGGIGVLTYSRGFEVPAGDTTFYQVCQQMNGGAAPIVQDNSLTAVYTPHRV